MVVLNLCVHMVIAVKNSMIAILYKITFLYMRMILSDVCSVLGEASRISEVTQPVIIIYMLDLKIIPVKFVGNNLPCIEILSSIFIGLTIKYSLYNKNKVFLAIFG